MSLIIRKKSAYTWEHYFDGATVPYITNVFNINNGGNNTFQLVDYRGSNLQAVPIADITLYDDTSGGIAETFSTFAELNTRLGILQYPPMKTSGGSGGGVESVSGVLLNNTDPLNPIVNGLIVDAYSQVKEISFSGATVTNDGSGKVTVTITGGGVTEFIELTDVPASYTGQGSKVVSVKADESGLEFVAGGGSQDLQSVLDEGNTATNGTEILELRVNEVSVVSDGGNIGVVTIDNEKGIYLSTADFGDGSEPYIEIISSLIGQVRVRASNVTTEIDVQFPDKSGTVAFLSDITGGAVDSVNGQTGVVVLDSDDINEGATNLYFTDARALGAIPDATPTVKGIAKLYTSLGSNTDGAVDQNTVNTALQGFIPLSGTTVGNPVTGDIEINDTKKIFTETDSGSFDIITDIDNNLETTINVRNSDNTARSSLLLSGSGNSSLQSISTYSSSLISDQDGVKLFSNNPNYKGIEGENDYSEIDPSNLNIYAQRQYVENGLALKANLQNVEQIIRSKSNGTFGSHTGDTAETVIAVIDIDANEFEAGDWSSLYVFTEKNGTAGTLTIRLRAGVNGNTSDALISTSTATGPTSRYLSLSRVSPRFLTGNLLNIFSPSTLSSIDIGAGNSNTSSVSLTPSSAWKLTITAQLGSSGETVSLSGYRIGKIKSF